MLSVFTSLAPPRSHLAEKKGRESVRRVPTLPHFRLVGPSLSYPRFERGREREGLMPWQPGVDTLDNERGLQI